MLRSKRRLSPVVTNKFTLSADTEKKSNKKAEKQVVNKTHQEDLLAY